MNRPLLSKGFLFLGLIRFLTLTAFASTTWYVDGVSGNDSNNCLSAQTACKTIGHAISVASAGDSLMIAAATYTEHLAIGYSLNLIGSGASTTIIDGGQAYKPVVTISNASADVALSSMTISHGGGNYGAGINNNGTLTINSSTISGNFAFTFCTHSACSSYGGGIGNPGTLTINNSTISGNSASASCHFGTCQSYSYGGGIFNSGRLTMNNSTLSGNGAGVMCAELQGYCVAVGGGIVNFSTGTLAINNSTLSGNDTSGQCHYGVQCRAYVGGVYNFHYESAATIQNSIVSSNLGGNCYAIGSNGHNLSSDGTCYFNNVGDLNDTDPKLGPLQNNGGPTQTMALSSGSPAIDAGNPSGCTDAQGNLLRTDQRGMPRPDTEDPGGCDMGAYERQSD